MKSIDYELKARVLQLEETEFILTWASKIHRYINCRWYKGYSEDMDFDACREKDAYFSFFYPEEWKEAFKINAANLGRVARLRPKIEKMLSEYECTFLTLTFSDAYLLNSTPQARRLAIQRFLNSLECCYIGNVDFGNDDIYVSDKGDVRKGTKREHYHAIVARPITIDDRKRYKTLGYGSLCAKSILVPNAKALSKYVSKLTNHAVKETTKRCALLYSRKYKI